MHWQYPPYIVPLLLAAVSSAAVASLAWHRRSAVGAIRLFWVMIAVTCWSLAYALELMSTDLPNKFFWLRIEYFGIATVPVALLYLVLDYSGRQRWLTLRNRLLLLILPFFTILLVWTNEAHGLIYREITLDTTGSFTDLALNYGVWFRINAAYSYLAVLLGTLLLVRFYLRATGLYRAQAATLLCAALAPWLGNVIHLSGLSPFENLDLTPFAFTITGLASAWALFRYRLLDIVPVARDAVIESMDEGVIVLDMQKRIVDVNPAGERFLDRPITELIGHPATRIFAELYDLPERFFDSSDAYEEIVAGEDEVRRFLGLRSSALLDKRGRLTGQLLVMHDMTLRVQADRALQESEDRFRSLSEASEEGIAIHDRGVIVDANEALARMFGYELSEMIGTHARDYTTPEGWDLIASHIALEDEKPYVNIGLRKDGSTIRLELVGKQFQYRGKNLRVSVFRDISERIQAESALWESEVRYRTLFEDSPLGVLSADVHGHILAVNAATLRMLGSPSVEATRKINLLTFPPLVEAGFSADFRRCLESKTAIVAERRYQSRWGKAVWARYHLTPMQDEDQRTIGLQAIFEDVTERRRADQEIGRQVQRVEQIMATVPDGVLMLDGEGRVVLANPVAEELLLTLADIRSGQHLTQLGGRPLSDLLTPPPDELWHLIEIKDLPARFVELIARPMEAETGKQGWVIVMRDVTREREVQDRVQQQERLAAVGQLAAGIAHDFSNIMAVISLYSQMAQRDADITDKTRQRLETVDEQAKRASNLIQQILDFGRKTVMERRPLDMVPLLKEQVKLLERTLPESIQISLTHAADEYTVDADLTRIQQVILNLAVNARDAMPEGGQLDISLERLDYMNRKQAPLPGMGPGEWILLRVSDTGSGIAKEQVPHIFEPFFTTKEAGKGAGLGLAQVYGIVKQHEGYVDVSTKLGEGTTFYVYLPALPPARPSVSGARKTPDLQHGQGQTIMVVEDDNSVRDALLGSLEILDYHALGASNGQEALDIYKERAGEISLVLTDLVMPRMGGKALISALQQMDPAVKVVVLTGHPLEDISEGMDGTGAIDWLQKPPGLDRLAAVIQTALQER